MKRITSSDKSEKERIKRLNKEIASEIEDHRNQTVELEQQLKAARRENYYLSE